MIAKIAHIILLLAVAISVEASENKELDVVEARGKGKFALLNHFFYVVATKLFVLKIVYGAIFYALICKGWYFLSWFIHYLKEKKQYRHEYGHNHYEHDHYGHVHYGHEHYGHDHYGHDSYAAYAYDKHGSGDDSGLINYDDKKIMYDSDGSYSVKG